MHPGFVSRDRQASTQLSSIHSQTTQETIDSEDEIDEDDIYITDPEGPRQKRKRSKSMLKSTR